MGSAVRHKHACDLDTKREQHAREWGGLLDATFAERPTWRMGFDEHVRARRAYLSKQCFELYHTRPAFAEAHDARIAEQRALPMPPWRGQEARLAAMGGRNDVG